MVLPGQRNNATINYSTSLWGDGAEACELVVCYLPSQFTKQPNKISLTLYRDDRLAVSYGTPREVEITKQKICKIFDNNGLKITVEANKKYI